MKYQILICLSYQMMLMFIVSILTILFIKPSTFEIYLTSTSFYRDVWWKIYLLSHNYAMMLVLTVSLLIILFIKNSTFAIHSILNPKCLIHQKTIIVNWFWNSLIFSTLTEMNNPTQRGHKDYLSVW